MGVGESDREKKRERENERGRSMMGSSGNVKTLPLTRK